MTELSLPQKIVAIDEALVAKRIAHAFGGALALAYYAEPRATIDIDINVFLSPQQSERVTLALAPLGVDVSVDVKRLEQDGQCRLRWGRTPIDVFLSYDQLHERMRRSLRRVTFADRTIPILAPEHLAVCKAVFDRPKDWLDIEQMLVGAADFDGRETKEQLERLVGRGDPRFERLRELLRDSLGNEG